MTLGLLVALEKREQTNRQTDKIHVIDESIDYIVKYRSAVAVNVHGNHIISHFSFYSVYSTYSKI